MRTVNFFFVTLLAAAGWAQTQPAWTALSVPGGAQLINVQSVCKVIAYSEPGQV